jgi:iron-sulfur cluster repair protein YtfE (RIC family)
MPAPIKRSKELAPLSREHHEGLLFVYKIRQGLKGNIPAARIAPFCTWSLHSHFDLHFKREEKELVPVLEDTHPMMQRMLEEHQSIRNQFASINEHTKDAVLEGLAQSINDHIRFEERVLFPLIEQTASRVQLKAIEQSLAEEKRVCTPWHDEFWIRPK